MGFPQSELDGRNKSFDFQPQNIETTPKTYLARTILGIDAQYHGRKQVELVAGVSSWATSGELKPFRREPRRRHAGKAGR